VNGTLVLRGDLLRTRGWGSALAGSYTNKKRKWNSESEVGRANGPSEITVRCQVTMSKPIFIERLLVAGASDIFRRNRNGDCPGW
jgi:hypothetical protein